VTRTAKVGHNWVRVSGGAKGLFRKRTRGRAPGEAATGLPSQNWGGRLQGEARRQLHQEGASAAYRSRYVKLSGIMGMGATSDEQSGGLKTHMPGKMGVKGGTGG